MNQHSIIVRVMEHKAEGIKSLEEVKADIISYLQHQKAEKIVLERAEQIAKSLSQDSNTVLPENVKFGELETWVYAENREPVLNNVIFSMNKPVTKSVYKASKTADNDIVLIELNKVEKSDLTSEQAKQFNSQLVLLRQVELQNKLINALRSNAKIEVNESFLNQE